MNVVLFGQKWLAAEVLTALSAMDGVRVLAVCPDGPTNREGAVDRFVTTAHSLGVPVLESIEAVPPCDLAVAAHCQRFIPAEIRACCGLGALAYHPSLLPRHRGRDAVHWTVAMRETIAGGTVYWMDEGADTGPIEAQDWCHVLTGERAGELWRRALAPMGVRLLTETVARLAQGEPPRRMQQDERAATWEPALSKRRLAAG